MNSTLAADSGMYDFMVEPVADWSVNQAALFPWLFIIPAEILALLIDGIIWAASDGGLPGLPRGERPKLTWTDISYCYFNRIVMLPFVAFLNVRAIWASSAVDWALEKSAFTFSNTVIGFLAVFCLADFVYYVGHRVVHGNPVLYNFIHKHHHGEPLPIRGWFDTCNAHPTDFFYTGFSTSPVSVLWLMPFLGVRIHIVTVAIMMYTVMFVGALGHSRLDFNLGFFNTRFHAGHHSMFKYNYAQNIELWDRLFGTYKELPVPAKGTKVE